MRQFFRTVLGVVTSKLLSVWMVVRNVFRPVWWQTVIFARVRDFFVNVFDVKPKHKRDYYRVFGWLVSKRLAFAVIICLGALSVMYIFLLSPAAPGKGMNTGLPVYSYRSIPLRFVKGEVRIKARSGYIAYSGAVDGGVVRGQGKLFARDGTVVYEGMFDNNMYNGKGKFYYPTGELRYDGDFADNLYQGAGKEYRKSGSLWYDGEFIAGLRSGAGMLYNPSGTLIYTGAFREGEIVYSQLLGKAASDVAAMYTGMRKVYYSDTEYCVELSEIDAMYSADAQQDSLDAELTVNNVTVIRDSIFIGSKQLRDIDSITAYFGTPDYHGEALVNLTEAAATVFINDENKVPPVRMNKTADFDDVFNVTGYDKNYSVYVFAYKVDGLMYTFYCTSSASQNFFMYSINS
ncbi:MAG: hypothetical protein LBR54_04540 [Oscillospiraceae bacterium]|jgi:hypothetical protein|nr:hypothetical protein [Oscillospiraceae bacterium]